MSFTNFWAFLFGHDIVYYKTAEMDERDIIEQYFWDGFTYHDILLFLKEYHDITMSFITLRRRLHQYGLSRRCQRPSLLHVWNIVHVELQGTGNVFIGNFRWVSVSLSFQWIRSENFYHLLYWIKLLSTLVITIWCRLQNDDTNLEVE